MKKQINYCLNLKKIDEILDNPELVCPKTDGTIYDFNRFFPALKFIEKIYKYEITLDEAIEKQAELKDLINKLNNYGLRSSKKNRRLKQVLKSAKKLCDARDDIIDLFEKGTSPYKDNVFKTKGKESKKEKTKKIIKYIEDEGKGINYELSKKHFFTSVATALVKKII